MSDSVEFDVENLPWLDKYYAEISKYVEDIPDTALPEYDLRRKLIEWVQNGFVRFPKLIEPELIDAYLFDIDEFLRTRKTSQVRLTIEGHGVQPASTFPTGAWDQHHLRIMDFHNASTAGKCLVLHRRIVTFLRHVFRQVPIAMQTLTFLYGSEQTAHQDYPYVVAEVPSNLAAAWIALEDVDPDAGPLFYFRGSHTVEKFNWGDGLFFTGTSSETPDTFAEYLERAMDNSDDPRAIFCPQKGDVFFWHSSLVHGGSPVKNPTLTRRSLVVHYSTQQGYVRDRRAIDQEPVVYQMNGGELFADPSNPGEEDRFCSWPLPQDAELSVRDGLI